MLACRARRGPSASEDEVPHAIDVCPLRVAQTLAKDLMHAQHEPASHIHDWPDRGGCPGAVAHARDAIQHHGRYVVVADIRDCYPSFNPDYLYQIDLLPPEPSRAALDSRELRYSLRGDVPYGYDRTEQTRPRGLLQGGAASSSILAYALNDLPEHLPNDVVPICQSDNFIIVCRSRVECEAAAEALSRYYAATRRARFLHAWKWCGFETHWMAAILLPFTGRRDSTSSVIRSR